MKSTIKIRRGIASLWKDGGSAHRPAERSLVLVQLSLTKVNAGWVQLALIEAALCFKGVSRQGAKAQV
jgi:hypothetical protein